MKQSSFPGGDGFREAVATFFMRAWRRVSGGTGALQAGVEGGMFDAGANQRVGVDAASDDVAVGRKGVVGSLLEVLHALPIGLAVFVILKPRAVLHQLVDVALNAM